MAVTTVSVGYVANQQQANRQFALQPTLTLKKDYTNVKVTGNLYQEIKVPYDALLLTANMVKIGSKYYDIVEIDNNTFKDNSCTIKIMFNPISTFLVSGATVAGVWERTPSIQHKGIKLDIADDNLITSRSIALPSIENPSVGKAWYYQITAKDDIESASDTTIMTYGGFAPWESWMVTKPSSWLLRALTATEIYYSTIEMLLRDIATNSLIASDAIIDFSVSRRCPFKFTKTGSTYALKNGTSEVAPIRTVDGTPDFGITKLNGSNIDASADLTTSANITLSDFERYCGRVVVCDDLGNEIHEIPTEYFNASNQLTYYCGGVSDVNGLYTYFKYADLTVIWPEGHLPWVGNGWQDYFNRNLTYDREMLNISVSDLRNQSNLDRSTSKASGMLNMVYGAGMGGMSAGVAGGAGNPAGLAVGAVGAVAGAVVAYESMNIQDRAIATQFKNNKKSLYAQQYAKEAQMKKAPSNNFQTGYGLDFLNRSNSNGGAKIKVQTPANLTATDLTNYLAYRGYPCGKYASFTLTAGYIKGNIYTLPLSGGNPVGTGPEMDMFIKELADGCKVI